MLSSAASNRAWSDSRLDQRKFGIPTISSNAVIASIEPIINPTSLNMTVSSVDFFYSNRLPVNFAGPVFGDGIKFLEPGFQCLVFQSGSQR